MSDLRWRQRSVRMMRREYIADLQRMVEADQAELARAAKQDRHINCEWIIGTPGIAPGMGWQTSLNTAASPRYAPLGDHDLTLMSAGLGEERAARLLSVLATLEERPERDPTEALRCAPMGE